MQFLVYLTVLMVSVSTILLEVHWLTSPPPPPKPAVQAESSPAPAPKTENPDASLSPVYPTKPDAPGAANSAANTQPSNSSPDNMSGVAPKTTQQAPAQQPAAQAPAQQPVAQAQTQQPTAQAPSQQPPAQTSANAALPQRSSGETTGVAARGDDMSQRATRGTDTPNVNNPQQQQPAPQPAAAALNNSCDVQACSSAYQSFRASDCTYQPFEGARRLCAKPPVQQTARDQRQEPERRKWSRDVEPPRDVDRSVKWRNDDELNGRDLDDDDSDRMVIRRLGPRW